MNNSTKKRELAPEIEILKLIAEMSQEDMRQVLGYAQALASMDMRKGL